MKSGLLHILLWIGIASPCFSSTDSPSVKKERSFSMDQIQEYQADPDFKYYHNSRTSSWWQDFSTWLTDVLKDWSIDTSPNEIVEIIQTLLKVGFWGLIIFSIAMIAYSIYKKGITGLISRKDDGTDYNFSTLESHVLETNWNELIDQAVIDQQFNVAIRLHFLHLLQSLDRNQRIVWHPSKSIRDYQRELSEEIKNGFMNLSKYYQFAWFREIQISESQYLQVKSEFQSYHQVIHVEEK